MPFPKSYCNICLYCHSDFPYIGKAPTIVIPSEAEESIKTTIAEGDSNRNGTGKPC